MERRSTRCDNQIRVCPEFSTFIQSESEKVHRRTDKERGSRDKDTASLESTVIISAKLQRMKRSNPREGPKNLSAGFSTARCAKQRVKTLTKI